MQQLYLLFFAISVFLFFRSLLLLAFQMENIKVHKQRLKQLKFERQRERGRGEEVLDAVTRPVIDVVFPWLNILNFEHVERELKFAKWNIDAKRFVALKLIAKAIGLLLFLILRSMDATVIGAIWAGAAFFLPQMLLSNAARTRRESMLLEFPDFIRITQGYLTANMTFERAVSEAAPFLSPDWQEVLRGFAIKAQLENMDAALEYLKEEIGTLEVKEFISLVRLTLEQGGRARDSFEAQAEKIQQMLYDMMLIKIGRRKMYGIIIQAPLLLCSMAVLGLPVVNSFMNMGI